MRSHGTPVPILERVNKNHTQIGGEFELERDEDDEQKLEGTP